MRGQLGRDPAATKCAFRVPHCPLARDTAENAKIRSSWLVRSRVQREMPQFSARYSTTPNATRRNSKGQWPFTSTRRSSQPVDHRLTRTKTKRPIGLRRFIGDPNMAGGSCREVKVTLGVQEEEFAAACRDFVLERKPDLAASIVIVDNQLRIANDPPVRLAFVELGLARLVRVLHLAIEGKAIALKRVPRLLFDLSSYKRKILRALGRDD